MLLADIPMELHIKIEFTSYNATFYCNKTYIFFGEQVYMPVPESMEATTILHFSIITPSCICYF